MLLQIQVRGRIYVHTLLAPVSLLLHYSKIHSVISNWFLQNPNSEEAVFPHDLQLSNLLWHLFHFAPLTTTTCNKGMFVYTTGHYWKRKVTSPVQTKPLHYLTHSHLKLFLMCAVWVVTFDSNEWVTQHLKKKTNKTSKLSEKKMGTSIDLCRYVNVPSVTVISKPTDHAKCFRVLLSYCRGTGCQNISEIYLNCHLAAVAWVVPLCGFVYSLVWLHRLCFHCCQVSQGKLDGTPGALEEEGGHWRTYCWPGDLGDRTGRADRLPPGCCTDSRWPPGCLQAPAAQGKGRKLVSWSCREQGERQSRD